MATPQHAAVVRHIRSLAADLHTREQTDGALLQAFLTRNDQAAFEALVRRHGPMVLRVCQGSLTNLHDAEDALQATFFVLAQRAKSIRKKESLASWLHGVAHRVAENAKRAAARRRGHERQASPQQPRDPALCAAWQELQAILAEEIEGLPETVREPFVLCCVENQTCAEAARHLDLEEGTVWNRLGRARKLLQERLTRRAITLPAGVLPSLFGQKAVSALVPAALVVSTAVAATRITAGQTSPAGLLSTNVAALMEGALKAMLLTKFKVATVLLSAVAVVATLGLAIQARDAAPPTTAEAGASVVAPLPGAPPADDAPEANPLPRELPRSRPDSPIPLGEAVEELNRKTAEGYFDRKTLRQPPLTKERRPRAVTVDEVVSAIQGWDRKKAPIADPTYRIFQQIVDSKALPPGASLYFRDEWVHPGGEDRYEYRVWRIQLDVMTDKNTGYGFVVREERLDRRIALLAAPGYSWLEGPWPASPRGTYSCRLVLALEDDRDAALLITLASTNKGVHDMRVVAFDDDGNRYLPARQRWGGASSDLTMLRFRLDPKKLLAAKVEYVGIEGITQKGIKNASEAAVKRAQQKGIKVLALPEVGKPYEFSLTTCDGRDIESRKLQGKVVLIDCWASWCGPCVRDMPDVKRVYEKWHDTGLEVIGLSLDLDPKAAAAAAKKYELSWPLVVVPPGEEVRELWTQAARIETIPRLLVVDRKGVLRADLASARGLEKVIAGLLAEGSPAR
jgi:RNA polymerase sigma factor (sigma-70 family)